MITRPQFAIQMERLTDTFGDKFFSEQRAHMMWQSVEGLEYPTVIAIVDSFIRSSKTAPLPVDFALAASEATKGRTRKFALGELQPQEVASCWDCADSGFIRVKRNETFEEWAKYDFGSAPCHCTRGALLIEAGKRLPRNPIDFGGQFDETWKKSYTVMPAYGEAK
jgi:hypothetical protein